MSKEGLPRDGSNSLPIEKKQTENGEVPVATSSGGYSDWSSYYGRTEGREPSPLLQSAISLVPTRGHALDLGAGSLIETGYLADNGFYVTAVERSKDAIKYKERVTKPFSFVEDPFEDYAFPTDKFDLVNATLSLPFTKPEKFSQVWSGIVGSLKKGGIFVGQFFGPNHDWTDPEHPVHKKHGDMTFHTREELDGLLKSFEIIKILPKEFLEGGTHWHVFHVIARKK
jgi:SAM-dependent methyltransferase